MIKAPQKALRIFKHLLVTVITCSPLFAMPLPSFADNTEIFFGYSNSGNANTKPNVLFILDNSGSMNSGLLGSTRIQVMKDAFEQTINEVSGINASVMQFTFVNGGAVNQAFLDLDDTDYRREIPSSSLANRPQQTAQQSLSAESDPQVPNPALGTILDNGRVYTVTTNSGALGYGPSAGQESTESASVLGGPDDRSEILDDGEWESVDQDGYLYFGQDAIAGLRFQDIDIPPTATIVSASITFTGHPEENSNNEQLDLQIRGYASNNPPFFSPTGVPPGSLETFWQSQSTDANQRWSIGQRFISNEPYKTSDISSVVQEIIQNGLWSSGDTMMLMIKYDEATDTEGERTVHAYDTTQSINRPVLNIQWIDNAEQVEILSGMHFAGINVPQGAEIVSAAVVLHAAADDEGSLTLDVSAELTGDAQLFPDGTSVSTTGDGPLATLPRTTESVSWSVDTNWDNGSAYQSPDLSPIFDELVNQDDWCGGNSVNLLIQPAADSNKGQRRFGASQNSQGLYPELRLAYRLPPDGSSTGCYRRASDYDIKSNSDDARELSDGTVQRNSENLTIDEDTLTALRFDGIALSRGADIFQAQLNVRAKEAATGATTFNVWVESSPDSEPMLSNTNNISSRSQLGPVTWTINEDWAPGQTYSTGDIGLDDLLDDVMARDGWEPGQAVTLLLQKASGNDRTLYTNDERPDLAASLTLVADAEDYATNISFSNKDVLISRVNNLRADTWTPIVDTLYEASRYYRGESVDWGRKRLQDGYRNGWYYGIASSLRVSHPDSYKGGSVTPADCSDSAEWTCALEEITGSPVYQSPIQADCQSNHIVLLTDGQANYNGSQSRISGLIGEACDTETSDGETIAGGERCARDLVKYLRQNSQNGAFANSTVKTHTIAFALNPDNRGYKFMEDLAAAGGGLFTDASNTAELKDAFNTILKEIQTGASTFTQPSLMVNQFNQVYHRNELYYSLFQPSATPIWPGNVKGYRMALQEDGTALLEDALGQPAVDPDTGFFKKTSKSFWSSGTDGDQVALGGVVDNLPLPNTNSRNIYTFLEQSLDNPNDRNLDLTADANQFVEDNPVFLSKPSLLGVVDIPTMRRVVRWARGYDEKDIDEDNEIEEPRFQIGDPLHSSPVVVTYGVNTTDSETGAEEEGTFSDVIFVGNNDGFLRSFDASNGREIWGFLPEELLSHQGNLFQNGNTFAHEYGLDNTPVLWVYDAEKDGRIDDADDQAHLFATMRRGGRNVYALDVTDKTSPRMKWVIRGGEEGDYQALGQTWSPPVVSHIKIDDNEPRRVLIMGGGYDPIHDDNMDAMVSSTMGNALYIIDADTGELITHASKSITTDATGLEFTNMDHAFPAAPSTFDHNLDGLVDQVYITDIAGKVWRFDVMNGEPKEDILQGGVIASLGGSPATGGPRRFFSKINLSLIPVGGRVALAVAIGSGEATAPLNTTIENRFFVITQKDAFNAPETYRTLTPDTEIIDITDADFSGNPLGSGGFYRTLGPGEKIVSSGSSTTFNGTVMFSTYTPNTSAGGACRAPGGTSKLYAMRIKDGQASLDLTGDGTIAAEDISITLQTPALPAAPTIMLLEGADRPIVLVGTEAPLEKLNGAGLEFIGGEWERVFWENKRE